MYRCTQQKVQDLTTHLSGIGPEKELRRHGIKQLHDLPVGQNLQDHCMVLTMFRIKKPDGWMTMDALNTFLNPLTLLEYYTNGTGPLTSNGMGLVGVMHTPPFKKQKRPGLLFSMEYFLNRLPWVAQIILSNKLSLLGCASACRESFRVFTFRSCKMTQPVG